VTILSSIDIGGGHPYPAPQLGQMIGSAIVEGSRTIIWPRGRTVEKQDVRLWVTTFAGLGGQSAGSRDALRYLLRQLEELGGNPDLQQPGVFIQWLATAQAGMFNVTDPHDGWYVVENVQPDYAQFVSSGSCWVRMTVQYVGPLAPSGISAWYAGGALASTYSATAAALLAYPVGATGQQPTTATRAGGEGSIPISTLPASGAIDPGPFVPPATIAGLFTGGCRVFDTISTGSNPVPVAGGTYVHANWVEVFGTQHDFIGDMVVTNGLNLLLYAVGQPGSPRVYLWNTSLGTPTWQLIGDVEYQDTAGNVGTLRSYDLDRLGLQEVRVRCRLNTSAGNWARLNQKLQAGRYETYCEFLPLSQADTNQLGLVWSSNAVYVTGFTDTTSSTTFPSNLATTTVSGYAAAQGSASGSPIFGWLYQNIPTTAQGRLSTTSLFGLGDAVGPLQGASKLYGFFASPYSGAVVLATARGIVAPLFAEWAYDRTVRWVAG
jgi:hypothetical protein